jgi:type I restriction enzyme, R subunit
MEGIERNRRLFLLVMATGTGKTRTCIALIDALMRAGHVQRSPLPRGPHRLAWTSTRRLQRAYPDEPRWPELGEKSIATDRRIYVATYPTMLNIIRDEANSHCHRISSTLSSLMRATVPSTTPMAKCSTTSTPSNSA